MRASAVAFSLLVGTTVEILLDAIEYLPVSFFDCLLALAALPERRGHPVAPNRMPVGHRLAIGQPVVPAPLPFDFDLVVAEPA